MVKDNNKKFLRLLISIGIFGLMVGTSYAYFSVIFEDSRTETNTLVNTEILPDAVVISNVDKSAGSFNATDIYPGHKEVASLSIGASGTRGSSANYQFVYDVETNELNNHIKAYLY